MPSFSLLWVDDDFADNTSSSGWQLNTLRIQLEAEMRKRGIDAVVKTSASGSILEDLALTRFDLIILDIELAGARLGESSPLTGFEVLERVKKLIASPPVVLLSRHLDDVKSPYKGGLLKNRGGYLRTFRKNTDEIECLADFIKELFVRPPFAMVVLSDLHVGHIPENSRKSFLDTLLDDLRNLAQRTVIHYFVALGDFAWKSQREDLPRAAVFLNEIRHSLGVRDSSQFHFCPGNHDVSFLDSNPWNEYNSFVEVLASGDPSLRERFFYYQEKARTLQVFDGRTSTLAVSRGKQESVLFAALNSCRVERNSEVRVSPEIGERQWSGLRKLLRDEPSDQLRIAMFHHPLFAAPGGDFPDERPLADQAKALHELTALGFRLVLHGHSHFSAVYEHTFASLGEGGSDSANKLTVISCPTCGAEPSSASPLRQYLIVGIGPGEGSNELRTLSIRSRIYNQRVRMWEEGTVLKEGRFLV